ncbi:hypothetical protein thalar_01428 [Litoreibacter arenae DSM 19593]|uniref:Uncharacterized protein n=1 Tax=Litoreibacter arenae DSM 19593 TaxID=1123360 RepID=S9QK16_9RHOB|nr:hypothetical protein thalar_01428 [Litoreibacter arenae DSM 19593]
MSLDGGVGHAILPFPLVCAGLLVPARRSGQTRPLCLFSRFRDDRREGQCFNHLNPAQNVAFLAKRPDAMSGLPVF